MLIVVQRIACTSLPAAAPVFRAAMRWFIGFAAACWHAVLQNALRSSAYFFIFRGPTGRTCTCCQRRQVRDLIIAYIGTSAAARVDPWSIPCRTFSRRIETGTKEIQKPLVFGGAFAHFYRCWQKWVAPESEISPRPRARNPLCRRPAGAAPLTPRYTPGCG